MNSNKKNNLVYHYCSVDALDKILSSSSLRMSDIVKSNDRKEISYCYNELLSLIIKEEFDKEAFPMFFGVPNNYIIKNIPPANVALLTSIDIATMYFLDLLFGNKFYTHACCFADFKAKDLLSLWRGYGDDGRGVSIGFDTLPFNLLFNNRNDENKYVLRFEKVVYDLEEQKKMIRSDIKDFVDFLRIAYNNGTKIYTEAPNFAEKIEKLARAIRLVAPTMKHKTFEEEQEWRAFVTRVSDAEGKLFQSFNDDIISSDGIGLSKVKTNIKDSKIISYCDLLLDFPNNKIIKEIYLGPKCPNSEYDIQLLLATYGLFFDSTQIIKSQIPYV